MDVRHLVLSNGFSFKELMKLKNDYMKFKAISGDENKITFVDSIVIVSRDSVKSMSVLFFVFLVYLLITIFFDFLQTYVAVPFISFFIFAEIYKNARLEKHSILTEVKLIKLGVRMKINQLL